MTTIAEARAAAAIIGRLGGLKGGKATTPKKIRASRRNGKKGGRPPKGAVEVAEK